MSPGPGSTGSVGAPPGSGAGLPGLGVVSPGPGSTGSVGVPPGSGAGSPGLRSSVPRSRVHRIGRSAPRIRRRVTRTRSSVPRSRVPRIGWRILLGQGCWNRSVWAPGLHFSPPVTLRLLASFTGTAQTGARSAWIPLPGSKLISGSSSSRSTCDTGTSVQLRGFACTPLAIVSKWRWHPVDYPVVPTRAMTSPTFTNLPCLTALDSK